MKRLATILLLVCALSTALAQGRYVFPTEIAPLTHTTWGQDYPYNKLCPTEERDSTTKQAYAGCGPLVMSQAMRRYSYPPSSQLLGSVYDWEKMFDAYTDTLHADELNAVARLIADCGTAAYTAYGETASSTKLTDVITALKKYFGYSPYMSIAERSNFTGSDGTKRWHTLIYNELKAGRPVIMRAEKGPQAAHVFIVDGCRDSSLHVNWGWGGKGNGYFHPDSLGGYRLNQRMIIGVAPQGQYTPTTKKIYTSTAGRLAQRIGETDRRTLRHLKIIGPVNRADLALLRQMAGGKASNGSWKGDLCTLDLSEAVILTLPDSAFYGCESLTYVDLPLTLPEMGDYAFYGCPRLNRVDIHSMVASIGQRAFYGCFCLTGVSLPFALKSIGANAFNSCTSLTEMVLPPLLTSVGAGAFANCKNLKSLTVPRSVKQLGNDFVKGTKVKSVRRI